VSFHVCAVFVRKRENDIVKPRGSELVLKLFFSKDSLSLNILRHFEFRKPECNYI